MSTHRAAARLGLLQICLAAILWGTGGLTVQLVRERISISVLTLSAYRMVIAALVLLAVLALIHRLDEFRLTARTVLVGACTGAYQALYFAAVAAAGVTVATVVSLALAPLLLTAAEAVHSRTWPRPGHIVGLAIAVTGLILVSTHPGQAPTGPRPVLGVLLAVAAGAGYAVATAAGRTIAAATSPLALTAVTTAVGATLLLPFGLAAAAMGSPLLSTDPEVIAGIVYLGVATMAVAYALLYAGLRVTKGSTATVVSLLEPVTAAVAAAVMLGERIGAMGVVGAGMILVAVLGLGAGAPGG